MTKPTSNKIAAGAIAFVITAAAAGFGYQATVVNAQIIKRANPFCNIIMPRATTRILDRFTKRKERVSELSVKKTEEIKQVADKRSEELNVSRTKRNASRTALYAKLHSLAENDSQKQAVEKFITNTNETLSVQEQAIDSAIKKYKNSLISDHQSRTAAINDSLVKYEILASNALAKAKSQCDGNINSATVKNELKNALRNGQEQLKTDLKQLAQTRIDRNNTRQNLQNQMNEATEALKTTATTAREELKKTFDPGVPEQ